MKVLIHGRDPSTLSELEQTLLRKRFDFELEFERTDVAPDKAIKLLDNDTVMLVLPMPDREELAMRLPLGSRQSPRETCRVYGYWSLTNGSVEEVVLKGY